jgi:hypothetical protein
MTLLAARSALSYEHISATLAIPVGTSNRSALAVSSGFSPTPRCGACAPTRIDLRLYQRAAPHGLTKAAPNANIALTTNYTMQVTQTARGAEPRIAGLENN